MDNIIIIGLLTIVFCVFYQLIFRKLYQKLNLYIGIVERSAHSENVTATGGISLFLAVFSTTLCFYFSTTFQYYNYSILLPLSILFITGFYDDLENADFKLKLLLQIIVAKLLIDQGFVLDAFYGPDGILTPNYFVAQILTTFIFVAIVNSINFIDGIDGLAISFCLFLLISINVLSTNNSLTTFNSVMIFGLLPGLYFNFKKSGKVFLGDSGSLFIGGVIAMNCIHLLDPEVSIKFGLDPNKFLLLGLLIFYPLVDLSRIVFQRMWQKDSPFKADKSHFHHLVLEKTHSHAKSLLIIIALCLSIFFMGLLIWELFDEKGLLVYLILSFLGCVFLVKKR